MCTWKQKIIKIMLTAQKARKEEMRMTQEDNIVKILKEIKKELCRIRTTAESIND